MIRAALIGLVKGYRLFLSPEYEDEHSPTLDTVNHQEFTW